MNHKSKQIFIRSIIILITLSFISTLIIPGCIAESLNQFLSDQISDFGPVRGIYEMNKKIMIDLSQIKSDLNFIKKEMKNDYGI